MVLSLRETILPKKTCQMGESANIATIIISLFHIVGYVYFVIVNFALTALKRKSE